MYTCDTNCGLRKCRVSLRESFLRVPLRPLDFTVSPCASSQIDFGSAAAIEQSPLSLNLGTVTHELICTSSPLHLRHIMPFFSHLSNTFKIQNRISAETFGFTVWMSNWKLGFNVKSSLCVVYGAFVFPGIGQLGT